MRRHDDLRQIAQWIIGGGRLLFINIERSSGDLPGLHSLSERLFVDDSTARAVDDADTLFHLLEFLFTNKTLGLLGEGNVNRDEIRASINLVELRELHLQA